jgi:hypothetical protein
MPGFSSITGDESIMFADNASFDGSERDGKLTANGQLWIGAGSSPHVRKGTLTSTGGTVSIVNGPGTINLEAGASTPTSFTGNTGVATPAVNNINIVTANSTVEFVGSGSTLTEDFGITNLLIGSPGSSINVATTNVSLGDNALESLTDGTGNTAIGHSSTDSLTTGSNNTSVGKNTLVSITGSNQNVAIGVSALQILTTSVGSNTAVGYSSLNTITTGTENTALGEAAGGSLTGSDSSNICIGNGGVSGDNNVIRIGTQGTGTGEQNQTHIAGVINTVSGRVVKTTTPGAYPYTTLTTDFMILVDSSTARTITPLAAPVTGTMYIIKDSVGSAASNNITITPSGQNIDGAASALINTNYGSMSIVYNGTEWSIV